MHILLISNYFPPEIGAAAHLFFYLGKELVSMGHKVTVLTGIPRYNVPAELYRKFLQIENLVEYYEGMKIVRTKLPLIDRNNKIRRGIEHFEISSKLFRQGLNYLDKDIDTAIVYSPPLTLYKTAIRLGRRIGFPTILNVQDLFPQSVVDLGMMNSKILKSIFYKLEYKAYKKVDHITVHSSSNADYVKQVIGDIKPVSIIENFIDIDEIAPGSKENSFSITHNLSGKFIVSFAGTLGYSQDIDVIVNTAGKIDNEDILFLIIGDGVQKNKLLSEINNKSLKNLKWLPMVPKEDYPSVLHSSDISLVTLIEDVKTPTVPSKIISIMAAGVPVIASINLNGDAAKLIEESRAGYVISAGNADEMVKKILELYNDPEKRLIMGRNGREYVEKKLSSKIAAKRYLDISKTIKNKR